MCSPPPTSFAGFGSRLTPHGMAARCFWPRLGIKYLQHQTISADCRMGGDAHLKSNHGENAHYSLNRAAWHRRRQNAATDAIVSIPIPGRTSSIPKAAVGRTNRFGPSAGNLRPTMSASSCCVRRRDGVGLWPGLGWRWRKFLTDDVCRSGCPFPRSHSPLGFPVATSHVLMVWCGGAGLRYRCRDRPIGDVRKVGDGFFVGDSPALATALRRKKSWVLFWVWISSFRRACM